MLNSQIFSAEQLNLGLRRSLPRLLCRCSGFDTRTVQRLLEKSGKRAADFHNLQLENLDKPLEAVQMDELHGKTVKRKDKTEVVKVPKKLCKRLSKKRAKHGFIRPWP